MLFLKPINFEGNFTKVKTIVMANSAMPGMPLLHFPPDLLQKECVRSPTVNTGRLGDCSTYIPILCLGFFSSVIHIVSSIFWNFITFMILKGLIPSSSCTFCDIAFSCLVLKKIKLLPSSLLFFRFFFLIFCCPDPQLPCVLWFDVMVEKETK